MSKQRVLVITDRYPPDTKGGAELSLQSSLIPLASRFHLHIAALSATTDHVLNARHHDIFVSRIPFPGEWPPQLNLPVGCSRKRTTNLPRSAYRAIAALRYLVQPAAAPRRRRLRNLGAALAVKLGGHGHHFPLVEREVIEMGPTMNHLRELVADFRPDLIHADNLRSIVSASKLNEPRIPWVAMVRDNRFLCAETRGIAMVGTKPCGDCEFACLDRLPRHVRAAVRPIMQGDRGYRRNALRNAKALLTTSGWLRTQLARLVPERPVHLVPNGVGAPDWPAEAVEDISEARPMKVLFAGMLNWAKGPMELIEALPDLEACGFDYQLVFAGRGPLAGPIQKRAKQLGLPDRVDVIGHLDRNELVRLFAHAAIVVCPSLWPEPFGRIPLEAGLLGKPVIAYDIAGYRETIIPGRTGLLVPHADRKELAASIAELICDGTRRAELGVAARAHVRTSFSPQQSAYELEAAWRSVLKG